MTGECRDCKDYRECVPPVWFNFAEIRWCPYQVLFILANTETLRAGRWPQDPDKADDNSGQRTVKTEGTFTKPILILAEVETRLERTGVCGKLLIAQAEAGREFSNLDYEAKSALLYIKGWRRKKEGFSAWKKRRNYRQKGYQKVVKEEKNAVPV